jgi:transcription-repair coupling factor (superfamily II helicase)
LRVWDSIASQTKPVRVFEAPSIADVRLFAEAALKRGGVALYIARDDRYALMAISAARFFAPDLDVARVPELV